MLPLPILLALGGVGLFILFSPASPLSPAQPAPSSAPPGPAPTPPGSVTPTDAEPPFVPGFTGGETGATAGWYYRTYG